MAVEEQRLVIIEPDGPQGTKLGLAVSSTEQMKKFNELVGNLSEDERKNLIKLSDIASEVGISVIKP